MKNASLVITYLGIPPFAVDPGNDPIESLELADGPSSMVEGGGVLVYVEIL